MKKSEFEELIQAEVTRQLRVIVPKLVKPLVQEAVAGALASLLAEGITNPPQQKNAAPNGVLRPNIVPPATKKYERTDENIESIRSNLRRRMAAEQPRFQKIGESADPVANILAETAMEMQHGAVHVDSILDSVEEIQQAIDPETVRAVTRDYSALMNRMKDLGKLNG